MDYLVYIFTTLVSVLLSILQLFMLLRAVLSWLPTDDDSPFPGFVYTMTEPVILPVRMVLERSETVRSMPIDISFFISLILLTVVQTALPVI